MTQKPKKKQVKGRVVQVKKGMTAQDGFKEVAKTVGHYGLRAAGTALGGLAGNPMLGQQVGAWLSGVLGCGDYEVKENSLLKTPVRGVPEFGVGKRSVRVKHREYLGDIMSSVAFVNQSFPINPGSATTFPWLSGIADVFQQYRFHGLIFEFNSTSATALNSTNTALGTVVMSTQYNVNRAPFTSKLEMDGYEFSCNTKPSESLMHPVECAVEQTPLTELYVRLGAVPSGEDKRLYDWGTFQIATVGMQAAANIGELWVTYDVELYKPRLPPGGAVSGLFTRISNASPTNNDPLGPIQQLTLPYNAGNLGVQLVSNGTGYSRLYFPPAITTGKFYIAVRWDGNSTVVTLPGPTFSNCVGVTDYNQGVAGPGFTPPTGSTTTRVQYSGWITISGYSSSGSYIDFGNTMTLPTAMTYVNVFVESMPMSDSFI